MTRDDLIKALAREWFDCDCAKCRDEAEDRLAPVVEFVARWIEDHNEWGDEGALENAARWREDMGADANTRPLRAS
jgi:hypothetical protein